MCIILVVGYTGVMFQMQYLQVSSEAACFSEHFDTSLRSMSPFPLLKLHIGFLSLGK